MTKTKKDYLYNHKPHTSRMIILDLMPPYQQQHVVYNIERQHDQAYE